MYTITGVLGVKFIAGGQMIRNRSAFKQTLNSEKGIYVFLEEMVPFTSIKIELNGKDVTDTFNLEQYLEK